MAAPVPVKVRGTAAAGDSVHAQQDAQKKAVYRVLSTMLDNSDKTNDVANKIMAHYQDYTGKITINKKVTEQNKLYINALVLVDVDKLREAVHDSVDKVQKKHHDDVSAFLIRVVDEKGSIIPEGNVTVQKIYETTYKNRGFSTDTADALAVEAKVRLKALDMLQNGQVVADFSEVYTLAVMKDVGRNQAINQLLYKAAMNSSGYLAEQILAHWQKQKP